jgi:SAM-dependent methyltransferase
LIADPTQAYECFAHDYQPYAPLLATLSGDVIDIGGGNGIVRHYLPEGTRYIVIDPSIDWLGTDWQSLVERFPCLKTPPCFVRGIGEYLPFPPCSFDVVLSFWSLNHVNQPEQVFREVSRVLRPTGCFLVVLEDMEPRWLDIANPALAAKGVSYRAGILLTKLQCSLGRRVWRLKSDHIRIRESDIWAWSSQGFEIIRRAWIEQYLTYELRRT